MAVNSARNTAIVAATAAAGTRRPRANQTAHPNPYATTTSPAPSIDSAHATGATRDQAYTTTAAAATPAACSSVSSTSSDTAVAASVNTNSAPNNGHGGID